VHAPSVGLALREQEDEAEEELERGDLVLRRGFALDDRHGASAAALGRRRVACRHARKLAATLRCLTRGD
jgi:hypothetical protein